MGMNHWKSEGMGLKKTFPFTSSIRHYETVQMMAEAVRNEGNNSWLYMNVEYAKSRNYGLK